MSDTDNTPTAGASKAQYSPQATPLAAKIDGVRGHSAFDQPVSLGDRLWAGLFDLALASTLGACVLGLSGASPLPSPLWLAYAAAAYLIFWTLPRFLAGRTAGELLWGLKPHDLRGTAPSLSERIGFPPLLHPLYRARNTGGRRLIGVTMTLAAWGASAWLASETVLDHPVLSVATPIRIQAFVPPAIVATAPEAKAWVIAPFYYSLGAWPTRFKGQPVFYSIPYEKGPPERFIGRIQAHWDLPDTRLVLEGPKTPLEELDEGKLEPVSRARVRACFEQSLVHDPLACLRIRDLALARHVEEMRERSSSMIERWEARWFAVENASMPETEAPQGVRLTAISGEKRQDRYVLVSAKGTHQAFWLDSPRGPEGDEARALLEKSVSSLRVSDELGMGRAWVDREIMQTQLLPELREATRPGAGATSAEKSAARQEQLLERLARTQALLVSKASVDPKTYDTYFHLGGTAILLMRLAVRASATQNPATTENLTGSARSLVQSAHAFAMDLAPEDPRTTQMQDMVTEAATY